uniref:Chemokine interleukin-8-like domain-containing protein n=1 Tax=Salmo trutta TaxID=8032 RepID=A0A673WHT4_SALTR
MKHSVQSVCLLTSLSLYCLLLTGKNHTHTQAHTGLVGEGEGQFVPGRCECYDTKTTVRGPLSDLKVMLKGPACNTDQIIVCVKMKYVCLFVGVCVLTVCLSVCCRVVEKRTSEPVCVNPKGPLGKQLLRWWKK